MILYLTNNPIIDPENRHIMTPAAFNDWVSAQTWLPFTVPEFTLGGDPRRVPLPIWAAYAYADHTVAEGVTIRGYYFLNRGDGVPSPYNDDGGALPFVYFDLRLDAPHTFGLCGSNWAERGHSFFRRTSLFRGRGEYERDPGLITSNTVIGQDGDKYGLVSVLVLEEAPTQVFGIKKYTRLLCYTDPNDNGGALTYATAQECVDQAAKIARMATFKRWSDSATSTDVSVIVESLYLVPYAYISDRVNATPLYPNFTGYEVGVVSPVGRMHPMSGGEQRTLVTFQRNDAANAYEVGNGSLSIPIRSILGGGGIRVYARIQQGSAFQMCAEYDGDQYDLTAYCAIPYSAIDQSVVMGRASQQAITDALGAISVGVSAVGGNPVAAVAGGINMGRQYVQDASAAPISRRPGNAFDQFAGQAWGLLHLRTYPNKTTTANANLMQGPIQGDRVETPLAVLIANHPTQYTPHLSYIEGEIYPYPVVDTMATSLADRYYSDLFREMFRTGVFVWDSATAYRGNPFAL